MGQRTSQLTDISVYPCAAASEEFTGIAIVRGPCSGEYCTSVVCVVSTTRNIGDVTPAISRGEETGMLDLMHRTLQAKTTTMHAFIETRHDTSVYNRIAV